jgi:hypothetical protein
MHAELVRRTNNTPALVTIGELEPGDYAEVVQNPYEGKFNGTIVRKAMERVFSITGEYILWNDDDRVKLRKLDPGEELTLRIEP